MTDNIQTPDKPICQYCGNTPRTSLKNHYKHCKLKPRPHGTGSGKRGRPKGAGKGQEKVTGSGRKLGTKDKATVTAKQSLQAVFDEIGGVEAMAAWALRNQTEFYKLYTKLLPIDTNNKHNVEAMPALTVNLTHKKKPKEDTDKGDDKDE